MSQNVNPAKARAEVFAKFVEKYKGKLPEIVLASQLRKPSGYTNTWRGWWTEEEACELEKLTGFKPAVGPPKNKFICIDSLQGLSTYDNDKK